MPSSNYGTPVGKTVVPLAIATNFHTPTAASDPSTSTTTTSSTACNNHHHSKNQPQSAFFTNSYNNNNKHNHNIKSSTPRPGSATKFYTTSSTPRFRRRGGGVDLLSVDFSQWHLILFILCLIFIFVQTQTFQLARYMMLLQPSYYTPPYDTHNPHPQWCPFATCYNSPICKPCQRRFLIVIATGRSGSTTLMDMLDLLPNVRMAGENNGHLMWGYHAWDNLRTTDEYRLDSREDVEGAWKHHPIPEQALACPTQNMFEIMNPPPEEDMMKRSWEDDPEDIIGFKTVRFHGDHFISENGELYDATDFLMENFPCARFIINIRGDVEKQVKSWQVNFGMDLDGEEVRSYNRMLVNVASYMGPERARLLDMSEWTQKDNAGVYVLNDLIEWLGFVDCKYESLLHANKDGYKSDQQIMSLGKNCRYGGS